MFVVPRAQCAEIQLMRAVDQAVNPLRNLFCI